jgi:CRP/FNR family transcriptional regulator
MASAATQAAFDSGWNIHTPHLVSNNCGLRSAVANTPLAALSAEVLQELESFVSVVDYSPGDILFLEQESLSRVFVVLAGEVKLSLQDISGRRLTFRVAKRGAILGMHSALFGSLSECSAETLYRSRIALIARVDFVRFAERHPEAYRIASIELIRTLRYACETLRTVGLSSCVRRRLASQLLAWGERGNKTGDQTQFRMALTHAQIAEFIGAVRETVTRALTAFKRRGLVTIRGSMLTIPSTTALRKYAEGD